MTKVWYCENCGYEVTSRGRCHSCRERLTASPLPQLDSHDEDEEVGYRLDDWRDRDRGRLIRRLNELEILHRFEDDELVISEEDEKRVDQLVASTGGGGAPGPSVASIDDPYGADPDEATVDLSAEDPSAVSDVALLADAARRLYDDPTDMNADADVAEASTAVFVTDHFGPIDADNWAAVGRVTRSLLAVLGADDALEDQIRTQAGVLVRLLQPVTDMRDAVPADGASSAATEDVQPPGEPAIVPGEPAIVEPPAVEVSDEPASGEALDGAEEDGSTDGSEETVYELDGWLPEQRAHLGLLLEEAGISYEWDAGDLVVPASAEQDVEVLSSQVGGVDDQDDDDETRYQAVAELFAACSRLSADPADEQRAEAVLTWARAAEGPPLLGMDEVDWFRIATRIRSLIEAIESGGDIDMVHEEATVLHDMLRSVV